MGVQGLWKLLLPIGRRISLETLEGRILAVDASIWLTQFMKVQQSRGGKRGREEGEDAGGGDGVGDGGLPRQFYVIGFFRRICRLLYHGIRPVFVFDNRVMPELKRKEIARRRRRRDAHFERQSAAAVQRMAKKLLSRRLVLSTAAEKPKAQGNDGASAAAAAAASSGGGSLSAFSGNFHLPDEGGDGAASGSAPAAAAAAAASDDGGDDNVADEAKETVESSEWDRPVIEINDDDDEEEENDNNSEGDGGDGDAAWPDDLDDDADLDEEATAEYVASLPPSKRKDAIERAKRRLRMSSRKQFMPAAAHAQQFSQVQLSNFLKSSKFNQSVERLAKRDVAAAAASAATRQSSTTSRRGQQPVSSSSVTVAADRRTRIELIREEDESDVRSDQQKRPASTSVGRERKATRMTKKNVRPTQGDSDASESDDEVIWREGDTDAEGASRGSPSGFAGKRRVILDDDDDDDNNESSKKQSVSTPGRQRLLIHIDSSDEENDGDGDGDDQPRQSQHHENGAASHGLAADQQLVDDFGGGGGFFSKSEKDLENETGAGGFFVSPSETSFGSVARMPSNREPSMVTASFRGEVDVVDGGGGGGFVASVQRNEASAQELIDRALAQALQEEEDTDAATHVSARFASAHTSDMPEMDADRALAQALQDAENFKAQLPTEDDQNNVDESIQYMRTVPLNKSTPSTEIRAETNKDKLDDDSCDGEDDVDWEEGDDDEEVPTLSPADLPPQVTQAKTQPVYDEKKSNDVDEDSVQRSVHFESAYTEEVANTEVRKGHDCAEYDDFDNVDSKLPGMDGSAQENLDETTVALERAEATASRLADWAGRAFRRAMKEVGSDSKKYPSGKDATVYEPDQDNRGTTTADGDMKPPAREDVSSRGGPRANESMERVAHNSFRGHSENRSTDQSNASAAALASIRLEGNTSTFAEDRNKKDRDMDDVTDEIMEEIMQLLELFGVPYVEAPAEAEAQCAHLEMLGLVNGVVTEDSDVFVFGGRTVYKNIFEEQKYTEVYKASDAAKEMSLGRNEMVALALLLGGDYTEGEFHTIS